MRSSLAHKSKLLSAILLVITLQAFSQSPVAALSQQLKNTSSLNKKADICYTISTWYADRLKIDSAVYYANLVNEYSQRNSYETGKGKYRMAIALAQYFRGKNKEAEDNIIEAIEILSSEKQAALLGRAYWQLATIQGVYDALSARNTYWTASHFLSISGDTSGMFRNYFWLARTFFKTDEADSAAFYYIKSLAIAEQLKDRNRIHQSACLVGRSFLSLKDYTKAIYYLQYGIENQQPTGDKVALRGFQRDLCISLAKAHQFSRAEIAINEYEVQTRKLNDTYGLLVLNKLKGILEYERKNFPAALMFFQQAFNKGEELNTFKSEKKELALLIGKTEYEVEKYRSAIPHLLMSIQLSNELGHSLDEIEARQLVAKAFEKTGNTDSALFYFQSYVELKDSALSIEKQKAIIEVTTRYETEKKENSIRILEKEKEAGYYLLQLSKEQLAKQQLEDEKKTQQLSLVLQQNEISQLDAAQKALGLENEKKENERKQARLLLMQKEADLQKLIAAKHNQQTKLIYGGVVLALVLGGYVFYKYSRRKKLQNQQALMKERLRISRELHDEVGSTLSGIAMYSHITREQIKAKKSDEVERSLNNMHQSAGEMVAKLHDIVWLVNPERDSLQKLMERLEEYADNMAAVKNMEVIIDLPAKLGEVNLPVEFRRNIYLFCKEAINNAVKYSDASQIVLKVKKEQQKLVISVCDNGKGFNRETVKKGTGLVSMQERAEKINGNFSLNSVTGSGTDISLSCKIT